MLPLDAPQPHSPVQVVLPDLISHCHFTYRVNPHCAEAGSASEEWLQAGGKLSARKRAAFHGLKAGLLTSMCYPDAGYDELRVCCDFMNYLFHLDDLTDDMDERNARAASDVVMNTLYHPGTFVSETRIGKMTRDYWVRLLKTGSAGAQQRFMETFDFFFAAVAQQAFDRKHGVVPDLETYIVQRRDTSGCKPCWALIEYANHLDLPEEVMDHPVIRALGEAANDLVTWSNDIFSYNVEQARGDTHNMIPVVMRQEGLDLQTAFDFVGEMCKRSIDRFSQNSDNLPSFGRDIDAQLRVYAEGLASWIAGSLDWSFVSERYFGKDGLLIKASRLMLLRPKL